MESTGTFKQRKVTFVKEGVDIAVVKDPIWFLRKGKYTRLTPAKRMVKYVQGRKVVRLIYHLEVSSW